MITVSAGKIKKKVPIKVKTATSMIRVNTTYLVLQQGSSYALKASVYPAEADRKLEFESVNTDVVSVSAGGVVTARQCGTGTIIVKNSDTSTAVTVIVNKESSGGQTEEEEQMQKEPQTEYDTIISSADYPVISSDMLRYFYSTGQVLTIYGTNYTIRIDGKKICNYEDEFHTDLSFTKGTDGINFLLNQGKRLCGPVMIVFDDDTLQGKYVYLYNKGKEKYEFLKTVDENALELDTEGNYLLTEQKLSSGKIRMIVFIIAGVLLIVLTGVYIGVKKQYWFW